MSSLLLTPSISTVPVPNGTHQFFFFLFFFFCSFEKTRIVEFSLSALEDRSFVTMDDFFSPFWRNLCLAKGPTSPPSSASALTTARTGSAGRTACSATPCRAWPSPRSSTAPAAASSAARPPRRPRPRTPCRRSTASWPTTTWFASDTSSFTLRASTCCVEADRARPPWWPAVAAVYGVGLLCELTTRRSSEIMYRWSIEHENESYNTIEDLHKSYERFS